MDGNKKEAFFVFIALLFFMIIFPFLLGQPLPQKQVNKTKQLQ